MTEPAAPPPPRALVLGLSVLTVVVVGALSLVLFRDDLEPVADDATPSTSDPVIAADTFDRPDAAGLADPEHPWTEPAGDWIVQDGHAALAAAVPAPGLSLAVLPVTATGGVARITATAVEPGWGFAFDVQDRENFWAVVARPETASWSLVEVQDGVVGEATGFLAVAPRDGDRVQVAMGSDTIAVTVGAASNELAVESTDGPRGIGLVSLTPDNIASMAWDDVALADR